MKGVPQTEGKNIIISLSDELKKGATLKILETQRV